MSFGVAETTITTHALSYVHKDEVGEGEGQDANHAPHVSLSLTTRSTLTKEFHMPVLPAVDKLRIAFAGIILPYKGPHLLIQALKRLHDTGINFTCTLAGTTTDQTFVKRLRDFIRASGMENKIKFVGFLGREDLKNLFAKHNVLVFPSFVKEAFGISQVEAMAAGLTVVTSGTGGAKEIVEHDVSGIIFKSENDESLAKELLRLNQDKTRWRQIAGSGQKHAKALLDIEQSVDLLEKKFSDLLSEKQPDAINAPAEEMYKNIQPLMEAGRHEDVITELKKLLGVYPDFALAHVDLAVLNYDQGNIKIAQTHYEKAAALEPHNIYVQKCLAAFYYIGIGRFEDALQIYLKVLESEPEDTDTLTHLGKICESLQKVDDAKFFYHRVLEIDPQNGVVSQQIDALIGP